MLFVNNYTLSLYIFYATVCCYTVYDTQAHRYGSLTSYDCSKEITLLAVKVPLPIAGGDVWCSCVDLQCFYGDLR